MNPTDSIKYLQEKLNLPELTLDNDGCCVLTFDEIPVTLQATTDTLILTSYITQLSEPLNLELLKQLLAANLYWNASKGCTLSLEPDSLSVIAQIKASDHAPKIEDQLSALLSVTEEFRKAIDSFEERQEEPATPAESPSVQSGTKV